MSNIKTISKDAAIRLNLEFYSLTEFAKILSAKKYSSFFPFRDKGVDLIGFKANLSNFHAFQVKARTMNKYKTYLFTINKDDLEKLSKVKNLYWCFAMIKGNNGFDFIVISRKTIDNWSKTIFLDVKKSGVWRFDVKNRNNRYIVKPNSANKDITEYLLSNPHHPDIKL